MSKACLGSKGTALVRIYLQNGFQKLYIRPKAFIYFRQEDRAEAAKNFLKKSQGEVALCTHHSDTNTHWLIIMWQHYWTLTETSTNLSSSLRRLISSSSSRWRQVPSDLIFSKCCFTSSRHSAWWEHKSVIWPRLARKYLFSLLCFYLTKSFVTLCEIIFVLCVHLNE